MLYMYSAHFYIYVENTHGGQQFKIQKGANTNSLVFDEVVPPLSSIFTLPLSFTANIIS